jgi:hypothetical protein
MDAEAMICCFRKEATRNPPVSKRFKYAMAVSLIRLVHECNQTHVLLDLGLGHRLD